MIKSISTNTFLPYISNADTRKVENSIIYRSVGGGSSMLVNHFRVGINNEFSVMRFCPY